MYGQTPAQASRGGREILSGTGLDAPSARKTRAAATRRVEEGMILCRLWTVDCELWTVNSKLENLGEVKSENKSRSTKART